MSTISAQNCSICLQQTNVSFTDEQGDKMIPVDLHTPAIGPVHKVHRLCIFEWFQEQLEKENPVPAPNDLNSLPFTCPLCRDRVSLQEAENACGVPLKDVIKITRQFPTRIAPPPVNSSFSCVIL